MIKGEAHLIFRDVNTGEITKEVKQKNVVTDWHLGLMANCNGGNDDDSGRFPQRIYIGNWDQESDRTNLYVYDIYAGGITEAGVSQPRYLSGNVGSGGSFAYYYEYQQRFTPPPSTRTIKTIALQYEGDNSGFMQFQKPVRASAYLALSSPCTQTPTETLDIFYRIIWDNPNPTESGLENIEMNSIARRFMNDDTGSFGDYQEEFPYNSIGYFYQGNKMIANTNHKRLTSGRCGERGGDSYHAGQYIRTMQLTLGITGSLGRIYGSVSHRENATPDRAVFANPMLRNFTVDNPVGNIFPHSPASTGPFYQSAGLAIGDGSIDIDGTGWTSPDFNKLLHVEITQSGDVGTSEYRLHVMRTTGFFQNSYKHAQVSIPFMNTYDGGYDGGNLFETGSGSYIQYLGPHTMSYGDHPTKLIVFAHDWLGKIDVMTAENSPRFHNTSTPTFTGTYINQIVTVPNTNTGALTAGDVWVADNTTGLHRIHEDDSTIEVFDNTHADLTGMTTSACNGVTFTPGRIWAAFDSGLVYTDDNGVSFTVYDGTSSPTFTLADYNRVWFIQGDPNHADHRLGIVYNIEGAAPGGNRCRLSVYWWDSVVGHGNQISVLHDSSNTSATIPWRRVDTFRIFECSPNDGIWGCSSYELNGDDPAFFVYDSTGASQTFPAYSGASINQRFFFGWTKDLSGNDAMVVPWWDWNNSYFGLCEQDGTTTRSEVLTSSETPVDTQNNWIANAGDQGLKCITRSGMLIMSTIRNSTDGVLKFWVMGPAWLDSNDAFQGRAKHVVIDEFGWNGATWVKDHPGNKPTHAAHESLIEGLTIAFDDNAGAQTFVDNDYYTVAIVDGLIADGATEFTHLYNLYFKRTIFGETAVDNGGVLTATPTDYSHSLSTTERALAGITDNSGVAFTGGNYLNGSSSNWYCRLNYVHTNEAYLRWRIDSGTTLGAVYVGFSDASKLGTTPITGIDIDYGFYLSAGVLGGTNGIEVAIISNGTILSIADDGSQGIQTDSELTNSNNGYGRFNRNNEDYISLELIREYGSTDLKLYYRKGLVYTFTGVSSNLISSFRSSSASIDVRVDALNITQSDTLLALGDPGGAGLWKDNPDFYGIDISTAGQPRTDEIMLNGTPVTTVLYDDTNTILTTGEVSVLSNGHIRFSATDIGKTLTISRYNVLLNE